MSAKAVARRWVSCLVVVVGVSIGMLAQAQAPAEAVGLSTQADGSELVARLKAIRPDIPVEAVFPTPLEGVYAMELTGGTILYGTADGRYLFVGDLYALNDDDLVNLTEDWRTAKRRALIEAVALEDLVVFPAAGIRKAVVHVFTDVDCSFCRKLHLEMADMNALGIEVRYLGYPRAGIGSHSYQKIVSAWCSENRNLAITELKLGNSIPDRTCENPVADHYELGGRVGVTGTPAIVTEDGRLLPGYMAASDLAAAVGI